MDGRCGYDLPGFEGGVSGVRDRGEIERRSSRPEARRQRAGGEGGRIGGGGEEGGGERVEGSEARWRNGWPCPA